LATRGSGSLVLGRVERSETRRLYPLLNSEPGCAALHPPYIALRLWVRQGSSDMKRCIPRLVSDHEADAFLDADLSDLDFSEFKSGPLTLRV
jgi:hypothetical protein